MAIVAAYGSAMRMANVIPVLASADSRISEKHFNPAEDNPKTGEKRQNTNSYYIVQL